tara:strand:- start:286 stop:480 length:195 start_codon:yes stop_codon:yes gene_type:complete
MPLRSPDIVVDKEDQLEKIEDFCLPDETVHAVFDLKGSGTGFVALRTSGSSTTTRRFWAGRRPW